MATTSDVRADLAALRAQLIFHGNRGGAATDAASARSRDAASGTSHQALLQLDPLRPVLDLVFDLLVIAAAVAGVVAWGLTWTPLTLLLLGNRQRALGNLLHDAGHRNLCRHRRINDGLAHALIAPLLFADLDHYRSTHFRHHQWLGRPEVDPDFLVPPTTMPRHWLMRYLDCTFQRSAWWGSLWGHLVQPELAGWARARIVLWWAIVLAVMYALIGLIVTAHAACLWLLARASTFHLITTFREMCDHHGLQQGGVFSFTRDVVGHRLLRALIHPRHNGYHLTHHLMPAVPYYRLPQAHELLRHLPIIQDRAQVCDGYLRGIDPVVRAWQRDAELDAAR